MDKIYSRSRIKLPKLKIFIHNNKTKKLYYFLTMWIIVVITVTMMMKFITPPFEKKCIAETKRIGTDILNTEVMNALEDIKYEDIIIVTKSEDNKITMVNSNVVLINRLRSTIVINVQKRFSELERRDIKIPMGVLTGSSLLTGVGPNINIKVVPTGIVGTEFTSNFETGGINQTIHRLYLNIICNVSILTPYGNITSEVNDKVLFAENIIVGEIPSSYYNLEGIGISEAIDMME